MPSVQEITSLQNPRVKSLVRLRDQRGRRAAGLCIAEGQRAVERAIAAGLVIEEVWVCGELYGSAPPRAEGAAQVAVPAEVFRKIAYVREPEGLLAVFRPPAWSIDDLPKEDNGSISLVAVGSQKPGNLGAMIRTADAAGCDAVWSAGSDVDAMNPNAIRASTGCVFTMPTLAMSEDETIAQLKSRKMRIIAAYPDAEDAQDYTAIDYRGNVAIVVGPEDTGLDNHWHDAAKDTGGAVVKIPMQGPTADSLNASVAAAVLLYEANRQRQADND